MSAGERQDVEGRDHIDTREGWREVDPKPHNLIGAYDAVARFEPGKPDRWWVREEPLPPERRVEGRDWIDDANEPLTQEFLDAIPAEPTEPEEEA